MLLGAASDGAKPSAMLRLAYQLDDGRRGSVRVVQPRTPRLAVIQSPASAQTVATPLLSETNQFRYRVAPVFAAPPWPVLVGADCVALGPLAVDDEGLRFIAYAIAATISTTTTRAPMPHPARRAGSVDVRGGSVGSWEVIRRSCCGSQTNVRASVAVPALSRASTYNGRQGEYFNTGVPTRFPQQHQEL